MIYDYPGAEELMLFLFNREANGAETRDANSFVIQEFKMTQNLRPQQVHSLYMVFSFFFFFHFGFENVNTKM